MKDWKEYLIDTYSYGKDLFQIKITNNYEFPVPLDICIIDVETMPDNKRLIIYGQDLDCNNWVIWADITDDNQLTIIDVELNET